jgi:type I restriction enzyme S subunit
VVKPEKWQIVRMDEVLTLKNGERPQTSESGFIPIYGANGIMGYTSTFTVDNDFTIVIGRVGASGEIHLVEGKAWISDNAIYSESYDKNKIYSPLLFYLLKFKRLSQFASKTTHPIITQSFLNSFLIAVPPLPEQQKIAEILLTVDQGIEKVDGAIKKTQRLKNGLMQELLTKGIGHKEFKDTEIGRIPKKWEVTKIMDLGEIITGKTPSTSNTNYWNGSIPFITPVDIKEHKYVYGSERCITQEGAQQIRFILPQETVLVVCIGSTIGKTALTYAESVINQQINAIVCNENIDKHYVYYAVTFRGDILKSFSGVAAVPIIKKSLFEQFKLPLPPLHEQQKIAEILSTVDKRLELLRQRRGRLENIKNGLMSDLLTGRVRVRLEA